jgi:curved DNA-binding protein CbpA
MADDEAVDYYEALQISPNADAEMISRVYRLLAQRYHPDNQESGNSERFRLLCEAYKILSDPEKRARYDLSHQQTRQERWRLVSTGQRAENDFEAEQALRLTVLEVLYTRRRMEPSKPGMFPSELEGLTGQPREHLDFTLWFLIQKKLLMRSDDSRTVITAEGMEHLEQHYQGNQQRRLRLQGLPSERRASGQ